MGCCGSKRMQLNTSNGTTALRSTAPATSPLRVGHARPVFVYRGGKPLTLIGRVSGTRYYFASAGARVTVDPRDAPILASTPGLERAT